MKEYKKYIKNGLSINGNEKNGYKVFTILTQHFEVKSLDELTPEKFEEMIKRQQEYEELSKQLFD